MTCLLCDSEGDLSAVVGGTYYANICRPCLSRLTSDSAFSSGFQGYDRRRQYEDYAQDTVQPWDASGKPRLEFARLYPKQAELMYDKETLAELKSRM